MRQNRRSATAKSGTPATTSERVVKDIRRATRKHHSAEEKIRIVLDGLRGEYSIAELCRREGIAESLYYAGRKSSSRRGNGDWRAIPNGRRPLPRSRSCGAKFAT